MRPQAISWTVSVVALAATAGLLIAGPLNPPAGAVTSTFKTLSDIEPRIAVGPTTTPGNQSAMYRITQPGSYYLTGPIDGVAGKAGIQILADDVTLDLNGFTVNGNGSGTSGIAAGTNVSRIEVRNGTVRGWSGVAVELTLATSSTVRDVRAEGSLRGIVTGSRCVVQDSFAVDNTQEGFSVGNYSRVMNATVRGNYDGIVLGNSSIAEQSSSMQNRGSGIVAYNFAVVDRCLASGNVDNGVEASVSVEVKNCSAQFNSGDGIQFEGFCTITDNVASNNAMAGLRSNSTAYRSVIRGNNSTSNQVGIQVDGPSNLIIGNSCTSNPTNYRIVVNNRVATIVTMAMSGVIEGNTGGTAVSTPDANFAY